MKLTFPFNLFGFYYGALIIGLSFGMKDSCKMVSLFFSNIISSLAIANIVITSLP